MSNNIYKNGALLLILDTAQNISTASAMSIKYRAPDGTTGSWTAALYAGSTSKIYYSIPNNILGQLGTWIVYAYVTISTLSYQGDPVSFEVRDNWRVPL